MVGNYTDFVTVSINNVSNTPQKLRISELNLIITDNWRDLISDTVIDESIDEGNQTYTLKPYQTLWITNI